VWAELNIVGVVDDGFLALEPAQELAPAVMLLTARVPRHLGNLGVMS